MFEMRLATTNALLCSTDLGHDILVSFECLNHKNFGIINYRAEIFDIGGKDNAEFGDDLLLLWHWITFLEIFDVLKKMVLVEG